MDKLTKYRKIVKDLLNEYSQIPQQDSCLNWQLIIDEKNDRYLLLSIGWINQQRVHHCVIHLDIIDGQVWIQANNTDQLIGEELVTAGIDKNDIVLGLQPPEVRQFTDYGIPNSQKQKLSV